jgi:PAS fold
MGPVLDGICPVFCKARQLKAQNGLEVKEGKVVGLANHTALISRDGTERAIEDSEAPIKDVQGRILGVVMVFHDVTEKRRAEEALRRNEALVTQAVQVAGLGMFGTTTAQT